MEHTERFESWGIVEVMGHKRFAGHISEQAIGSASLVRVDVPETTQPGGIVTKPYSKMIGVGSVYCITPTTEEIARRAAQQIERWNEPLPVDLPETRQVARISAAEYASETTEQPNEQDAELVAAEVDEDDLFN